MLLPRAVAIAQRIPLQLQDRAQRANAAAEDTAQIGDDVDDQGPHGAPWFNVRKAKVKRDTFIA